jgi:shikimate dehydrogenase
VLESFQETLTAATRYCAIFGHPVRHSASPEMQNAAMSVLGLDWRYLAFDVHPDQLGAAIEGAKAMKFIGLNLTLPHKVLAMDMVDALDDSAKQWGAVNTIRFEARDKAGDWQPLGLFEGPVSGEVRAHGFNTDADGLARSLKEDLGFEAAGAKVLLLGAGGAGRVAALKLASEKVSELFLVNRTPEKAAAVAAEIRRRFPDVKVSIDPPKGSVDLLLNATSVGLKDGDGLPLEERAFPLKRARTVYDMIYRPAETPLLAAAKAAGCRTANGLGMLLHQGARALELWTARRHVPLQNMRDALMKSIYGN